MPTQAYYYFEVRFSGDVAIGEQEVRDLVQREGLSIANLSYRVESDRRVRRYSMTIASTDRSAAGRLAAARPDGAGHVD